MKSLFQISNEASLLASALIEGELSEELENALIINQTELQEKAINYGYVIKSIESDVDIIEAEIKRLQALKTSRSNAIERMKEAVLKAMDIYGIQKVESPTLKLSIRNNAPSVEVLNEYQIPDSYKKTKVKTTIFKTAIKKDIESGLEVPGAILTRKTSLQIK